MLRLVTVSPQDVEILFELVAFFVPDQNPDKPVMLGGLKQLSDYFHESGNADCRMVLTSDLHRQIAEIVNTPFMPADADRLGIPTSHYLGMCSRIPTIQKAMAMPEVWDPQQVAFRTEPDTKYLN